MSAKPSLSIRRRLTNVFMLSLSAGAALVTLIPLGLILYHLMAKGFGEFDIDFFLHTPVPVGETGGGIANAIVGSLLLIGIASLIGLPVGISGGIYLSEYAGERSANIVRFMTDILNGAPSIVIGLFIYTLVVNPMNHFSALAGGIALGIMMIPTLVRTTEESLKLIPNSLREAAYALGIPYSRALWSVILKTAKNGIVTGILLSIARITGETAPLLFTALGNQYWSTSLKEPISALPLQIFTYAISPFEDWQNKAWAAALTLIAMVFLLNIGARILVRDRSKSS